MLEIKLLQLIPITNPWTPISIKRTEYKDERTKNDGSVKTEKNLKAVADNLFFEKSR